MRGRGERQEQGWHNWSGSVRSRPREVVYPGSVGEVAALLKGYQRAGRHVRVVGSGHSFTPIVATNDVLMSLDRLQGVEAVEALDTGQGPGQGRATVFAGTKLRALGDDLFAHGVAQENLGDIDVQSIAGAISTGTHGTGMNYGILATQVEGLTLVTASGEVLECSAARNPAVFKAAQVSLGALGVITRYTLRVQPAYRMRYQVRRERWADVLRTIHQRKQDNHHFEFFWFPYTDLVQTKYSNETEDEPSAEAGAWTTFNRVVLENGVMWLLSECCRTVPRLSKPICKLFTDLVAPVDDVDYSHRLFATPRWVRFQEMEYNIPAAHVAPVLEEIRACIDREQFEVNFPLECRFVRGDDIPLSPAYGRESAYIAVHMYRGMPFRDYFRHIEAIFRRYDGRPHWGKMHTRTAADLAGLYPRWHDFQRVRAEMDPRGMFLNPYLSRLFGVQAGQAGQAGQTGQDTAPDADASADVAAVAHDNTGNGHATRRDTGYAAPGGAAI